MIRYIVEDVGGGEGFSRSRYVLYGDAPVVAVTIRRGYPARGGDVDSDCSQAVYKTDSVVPGVALLV